MFMAAMSPRAGKSSAQPLLARTPSMMARATSSSTWRSETVGVDTEPVWPRTRGRVGHGVAALVDRCGSVLAS
jgi:hypothetical protein